MKRILSILITAISLFSFVFFTGCTQNPKENQKTEYEIFCEDKLFADALEKQDLKTPEREIKSLKEFIYVMDYLAFYRISDTVFFDIEKGYSETFFNPYQEYIKAYEQSDLADVYPCRIIDDYYSRYSVIGIKFSISKDIAINPPSEIADTKIVKSVFYEEKGDGEYEVYSDSELKQPVSCENSEQLYYLVMNGYRPVPKKDSIAENIYSKAKEILKSIVNEDMSDFEKIKAVYDYLTANIRYDYSTAYSSSTYLVGEQAYYLEGVFSNKCAVCDGKAKAYALLLNMVGVPCYRSAGKNGDADHAWNVVKLNGKWYVSCATYGHPRATSVTNELKLIVPNHSIMLASKETAYGNDWGYTPQKHLDVYALVENTPLDVFGECYNLYGVNLKVTDIETAKTLIEKISEDYSVSGKKIEFIYIGNDDESFREELISYIDNIEGAFALAPKSEGGQIYQVVFYQ